MMEKENYKSESGCSSCEQKRGNVKNVKKYISSILAGDHHVKVEYNLFTYALASIGILMVLGLLGSGFFLPLFGGMTNTILFLFLIIVVSVMITASYFHLLCYKTNLSCSNGMMVGMTIGMITGFILGAIIAATNGMFIGSVVGLAFGIAIGFELGHHCGVMGALEGIMAGLMSGLMGAMTIIMLLNDNIIAMIYILTGIGAVTLGGLSYMMYREVGPSEMKHLEVNFIKFFIASTALVAVLLAIMFFGPKGLLTYF